MAKVTTLDRLTEDSLEEEGSDGSVDESLHFEEEVPFEERVRHDVLSSLPEEESRKPSLERPPILPVVIYRVLKGTLQGLSRVAYNILKTALAYVFHHPSHALLLLVAVVAFGLTLATTRRIHDKLILLRISDDTVSQLVEASRFQREFVYQGKPFTRVGAPEWMQREGVRAILYHARRNGLSLEHQAVLLATVEVESGFNPLAKAPTTTACGLFQFVRATGLKYELSPQDCMNPWSNAASGVAHYLDNYQNTVAEAVKDLSGSEKLFVTFERTYYLHHDGPMSSNPSAEVRATVMLGTQYLLKAYEILQADHAKQNVAGSNNFSEAFLNEFKATFNDLQQAWMKELSPEPEAIPTEEALPT